MGHGWSHSRDIERAANALAARVPEALHPLARVAYDYAWSWDRDGAAVFREVDPHRWELCGQNPVRLLQEASPGALQRAASQSALVARARELAARLDALRRRVPATDLVTPEHPIALLCAEFGVHASLPLYAGGLGGLAGDFLKEASDRALPLVGVGLLYRQGYFRQRLDISGWQHEYWFDIDPERLPAVLVMTEQGLPLKVSVPVWGRQAQACVWRVDVGSVPLYLLDTQLGENTLVDRWITARLYEGNRQLRLAQYAVLGIGGLRALNALGVAPAVIHANEGHAALAALESCAEQIRAGAQFEEACARTRERIVFTTHTPVPAGNETYSTSELLSVLPDLPGRLGMDVGTFLRLGRLHPDNGQEGWGLTPLALRLSRSRNGVSRRHGEVARSMWRDLYRESAVDQVPITHVTNGVHLPTWLSPTLCRLFERHFPRDWWEHTSDPALWEAVERIPDEELWAARSAERARLVEFVRARSVADRLRRGENIDYVEAAARTFDPDLIVIGFARRLATYKRLHLLTHDPERALKLLDGPRPLQLLFAGKAHPNDEAAKRVVQTMFALKASPRVAGRVAFLEDHDLALGARLVAGSDVWVNLPRPPLEASGTSGMKAALNGGLNLSVLDGWWREAYNGKNGWAIDGEVDPNEVAKDARDAAALYDLLEREVLPLFYARDAAGVPREWVQRMKTSLKTIAPRFSATRMLDEYVQKIYRSGPP